VTIIAFPFQLEQNIPVAVFIWLSPPKLFCPYTIMITGISHVNLSVPKGTLELAAEFYEGTLGFTRVPVPVLQKDTLAWYSSPPSLLFLPPPLEIRIIVMNTIS
jgi:hypothetical protein